MNTEHSTKSGKKEQIIVRELNAPRDQVWKAWTEPDQLKEWWGPEGYTAPSISIDLRKGGKYLYDMRSSEGKDYWSTGTFREIAKPDRLIMTDSFADEKGNIVPASYYGMNPDFPLESTYTVTFEEMGREKTRLTLLTVGIPERDFEDAKAGWNQSLDKLERMLTSRKVSSRSS